MLKLIAAAMTLATAILGSASGAIVRAAPMVSFPPSFHIEEIATNGTTIHTRVGGHGPAVLLLHGYGETGDMWAQMATDLSSEYTVIVPDLRGMGLSAPATSGFEKKNEAVDMAGILDSLDVKDTVVIAHDIGNMVAYSLAMQFPKRVNQLVVIDAPVPGIGPWEEVLKNPLLWHFRFGGPDMERLVAGRERIYLDRFWNDFSANPANFDEDSRRHYAALYARPGNMHAGFAQFAAFDQDAVDNRALLAKHGKLDMPVLAIGGEQSFGPVMATVMRATAINVEEGIVPASGHWIMEENPVATIRIVKTFLAKN